MKKLLVMCMVLGGVFGSVTSAGVISVNIDTTVENQLDPAHLQGVNHTAGVVSVSNWNDLSVAPGIWVPLHDNSGTTTEAKFQAMYSFYSPMGWSGYSTDFPNNGDQRLMSGHIYYPAGTDSVIEITNIPYAVYDVYVYYNSGAITNNSQMFSIDEDTSFSAIGTELTTNRDAAFVLSDGTNDANYVKFQGVALRDLTLRASSMGSSYSYINGFQIVEVPEPTVIVLLSLGAIFKRARRFIF